jgi:tetratricopeptide (TPR) repeat protein
MYDDGRAASRLSFEHLLQRYGVHVCDKHETDTLLAVDEILFPDEVAWLYNEIGLTSYASGEMADALAVWEQGEQINRVVDGVDESSHYVFQSLCNIGAAYIHFGRLPEAERYLRRAAEAAHRAHDEDHEGRIRGYFAMIAHLMGNAARAEELYKESREKLLKAGNQRAQSVFTRHFADLLISEDRVDEGRRLAEESRSLAEAVGCPDLVAYARATIGHVRRAKKEYPAARREYEAALNEARRIGMRRLEAEVRSELSRLALDVGDAETARSEALAALRIANESGLGLRQTHGLVVLGKATIEAGNPLLGLEYLEQARRLGERQQYRPRTREAEEALWTHRLAPSS